MLKTLSIVSVGLLLAGGAQAAPISLSGSGYTENFDTFLNTGSTGGGSIPIDTEVGAAFFSGTVKPGWWNGSGTTFGSSSNGAAAANSNRLLSFGQDTVAERALGLGWRDSNRSIGAQFTNSTGGAITQLDVTYDGELWFTGPAATLGAADTLTFEYSTDAITLLDGGATWTALTGLNFTAPTAVGRTQFTAYDGNAAGNRVAGITDSITGLSIANGDTFFIRWTNSASHAVGIDNFEIAVPEPASLALLGLGGAFVLSGRRQRVSA